MSTTDNTQLPRRPYLVDAGHIPTIAEQHDNRWGVYCVACSKAAEDYVWPCREGVDWDVPAVLVAAAELATMTAVAKSNKRVTEGYAQELDKALRLLNEARRYGNLSAGLRRRVDLFVEVNDAATFPSAAPQADEPTSPLRALPDTFVAYTCEPCGRNVAVEHEATHNAIFHGVCLPVAAPDQATEASADERWTWVVPCYGCDAAAGHPCIGALGGDNAVHPERRGLAMAKGYGLTAAAAPDADSSKTEVTV